MSLTFAKAPVRIIASVAAAAILAGGASMVAQSSVPELAFNAVDVLRTPAEGPFVGEVAGVGANSKGLIFVYTRTGHPYATLGDNRTFSRGSSRLLVFDAGGKYLREWGQDVYGFNAAIGLRVDPQDNVWTIDAAANQVVKFNADGSVGLVLGRKPETIAVRMNNPPPGNPPNPTGAQANRPEGAGVPGSGFNRPADVAWDKAGNIYVADGMGNNNRIAKFDKDGKFLAHWGQTGSEPGQFKGVKALALDGQGNVFAADFFNKRIQVFDGDGKFLREFGNVGSPLALCITRGATPHLYVSHAGDTDGMDDAAIYKVTLDGKVVGKFGSAGKLMKEFGLANSIDCRSDNELLVGELTNWRVQKVTLK
jgi:DNA-binding beta-propeller fold protein YncE